MLEFGGTAIDVASRSFVVAAAAAIVAGLVRGFSGFGSALVLAPALSAVYGPPAAVPVAVLMELALAVPFVPPAARRVDWRRIGVLAVAALVTVPIGARLLVASDPRALRWAMSAIVLAFVAILAFGWRYRGRPRTAATAATGALSGVLNGATGMAGPPVIFYYLSGTDSPAGMRASFIVFLAWVDVLAVASYLFAGTLTGAVALLALLLAIPYVGAAAVGSRLFRFASEAFYRRVALAILAAVAVASLPVA